MSNYDIGTSICNINMYFSYNIQPGCEDVNNDIEASDPAGRVRIVRIESELLDASRLLGRIQRTRVVRPCRQGMPWNLTYDNFINTRRGTITRGQFIPHT